MYAIRRSYAAFLCVATLAIGLTGCDDPSITYSNEGDAYTATTIATAFESVAPSQFAGKPVSDARQFRHEALSELRGQGGDAAAAADLITKTFPDSTQGVPVAVQDATFEGAPALVVVELIGPKGGQLVDERLWVISADGDVLYSGTR